MEVCIFKCVCVFKFVDILSNWSVNGATVVNTLMPECAINHNRGPFDK